MSAKWGFGVATPSLARECVTSTTAGLARRDAIRRLFRPYGQPMMAMLLHHGPGEPLLKEGMGRWQ